MLRPHARKYGSKLRGGTIIGQDCSKEGRVVPTGLHVISELGVRDRVSHLLEEVPLCGQIAAAKTFESFKENFGPVRINNDGENV